ncbi:12899_t:CDS:2 [Racocetra fulgida]|uniref:12899_t:CDS:1 n=1 Tax=Racocetra fulgida TaxID=60492 RepID=A0A9N8Z3N6_9GLOM|nr:12899_t:CDS:2 [Racocetra fulgida]
MSNNTIHIPYFFDNNKNITALNRSSIEALPQSQATEYHKNIAAVHAQYLSHLSVPNSGYMFGEDFTRQAMEKVKITASCNTSQQSPNTPTITNQATLPVNQKPSVYTKWSEQEDELLREAVQRYGPHKWSLIATHVPNRTPMQCSARWVGALNPSVLKGRWTSVEDAALTETVSRYLNAANLPSLVLSQFFFHGNLYGDNLLVEEHAESTNVKFLILDYMVSLTARLKHLEKDAGINIQAST